MHFYQWFSLYTRTARIPKMTRAHVQISISVRVCVLLNKLFSPCPVNCLAMRTDFLLLLILLNYTVRLWKYACSGWNFVNHLCVFTDWMFFLYLWLGLDSRVSLRVMSLCSLALIAFKFVSFLDWKNLIIYVCLVCLGLFYDARCSDEFVKSDASENCVFNLVMI